MSDHEAEIELQLADFASIRRRSGQQLGGCLDALCGLLLLATGGAHLGIGAYPPPDPTRLGSTDIWLGTTDTGTPLRCSVTPSSG